MKKITIIGLGYVGLPLAIEFGKKLNNNIDVYDPHADKSEVYRLSGIKLIDKIMKKYEVVILAVAHDQFLEIDYKNIINENYVLYDVKSILPKKLITLRL